MVSEGQKTEESSENVSITFVLPDNTRKVCTAQVGETILSVAKKNDIDLEGACGGCLACATCHVIVENGYYEKLEPVSEDEDDMLDLAFNIEPCSRLGCQIRLCEKLDGIVIRLPSAV